MTDTRMPNGVFEDPREIYALVPQSEGLPSFHVGEALWNITKIEAYAEAGPCGYQPAFLIWSGDKIKQRIIGGAWRVIYA